ncbi:MAG: hypothetical protein AAGJ83_13340, partial [Planctomycetota bacterium]
AQNASMQSAWKAVSDIPVIKLTYFQDDQTPNRAGKHAYAYAWSTAEGRDLARLLYDVTGLTATTFQGGNGVGQILVDGKKGELSNRESKEPIAGLLTDAELAAEPVEFPDFAETIATNTQLIETQKWTDLVAAGDIQAAALGARLTDLRKELKELIAASKSIAAEVGDEPSDAELTKLRQILEQRFSAEQAERKLRVELARLKLELVDLRRKSRQTNSKAIIDRMLKELLAD